MKRLGLGLGCGVSKRKGVKRVIVMLWGKTR